MEGIVALLGVGELDPVGVGDNLVPLLPDDGGLGDGLVAELHHHHLPIVAGPAEERFIKLS